MKITDLRCGRVFEGEVVDAIAGNSQPTDEQLMKYLGVGPMDKSYLQYKKPQTHKRLVLQYDGDKYYVIPVNKKFYKAEP